MAYKYRIKIIESSKLLWIFPPWVDAFTFGLTIRYRKKALPGIYWHEVAHCCQYRKAGILNFLWRYYVLDSELAYRYKRSEKLAYKVATRQDVIVFFPEYNNMINAVPAPK